MSNGTLTCSICGQGSTRTGGKIANVGGKQVFTCATHNPTKGISYAEYRRRRTAQYTLLVVRKTKCQRTRDIFVSSFGEFKTYLSTSNKTQRYFDAPDWAYVGRYNASVPKQDLLDDLHITRNAIMALSG